MRNSWMALVSLALAIVALPPGASADEYLTDAELKVMLSNTIRTGKTKDGVPWTIHSNADGTQTLVAGKKKDFKDSSTYVIRDNSSCETWKKLENGRETCWRFKKIGDNEYVSIKPDGSITSTFSYELQ
jgi:hypothetical protein